MVALGIHSAMDGVAVVVGNEITGRPDLPLLLAVGFHKLPEGLALALLLLGAGYSRRSALLWTWGIEVHDGMGRTAGHLRPAPPVPLRPGIDFRPCRRRLPLPGGNDARTVRPPTPRAGESRAMKRLNFTFDEDTADLLDEIAGRYYGGNKSLTVRAALESLAAHLGHAGWVISGYAPAVLDHPEDCHSCGQTYPEGGILYRPVFGRGNAPDALREIPQEPWLDCSRCVEQRTA